MKTTISHVGLDVDDPQYHGATFNQGSDELIEFGRWPTLTSLLIQLQKFAKRFSGCPIKICYEAAYVGFSLQRDQTNHTALSLMQRMPSGCCLPFFLGYKCDATAGHGNPVAAETARRGASGATFSADDRPPQPCCDRDCERLAALPGAWQRKSQ